MKINKEAHSLLQRKQKSYQNKMRFEKERLQQKYPQLAALNQQMNALGIALLKSTHRADESQKKIIQSQMDALEKKIGLFISNHDIPLLSPYFCPLCQDRGYRDNNICQCLTLCIMEADSFDTDFKQSALKERFSSFDPALYSQTPIRPGEPSPRKNAQTIYQIAKRYCDKYEQINDHLLFTGPPGIGKTFTSNCITNALIPKGFSIIYITAAHLVANVQDQIFKEKKSQKSVFRPFFQCDLLIIDDLGAELLSAYSQKQLYEVIDGRLNANQKMIISTNLSVLAIQQTYDERLSSRITGNFKVIPFIGEDIRLLKKKAPPAFD